MSHPSSYPPPLSTKSPSGSIEPTSHHRPSSLDPSPLDPPRDPLLLVPPPTKRTPSSQSTPRRASEQQPPPRSRRHPFVPDGSAKPPVRDLVSLLLLRRPASRAMDARASFQCRLVLAPPPSPASSTLPRPVQASPGPFPRRIRGFPLAPIC